MTELAAGPENPRPGAGPGAIGRAGQGRLAPTAGGLRALQQAVLRSFAVAGRPPQPAELADAAAPYGVTARRALAELHAADFLRLDEAGQIQVAYPFSTAQTRHRVQISGGACAYAMCAIDALGIAAMLGAAVVIRSADPLSAAPITISVPAAGRAAWDPATAVVFSGRQTCGSKGPAAEVCCGIINFFTGHAAAATWAAGHPDISGIILEQRDAQRLGAQIFGSLLTGAA